MTSGGEGGIGGGGTSTARARVALVGARGYTGAELVRLLAAHPHLELVTALSRASAGKALREVVPGLPGLEGVGALVVEDLAPEALAARKLDVVILALPNGQAAPWVQALEHVPVLIDLSADHRFDDAWAYGLPELHRPALRDVRRVANPGCYATGAQLGLSPLVDVMAEAPHVFGVSGYSGAGTTPSPRNDPEVLRDNLVPYAVVDHMHEREISRHLGHDVYFTPHVAPFLRGITLTLSVPLAAPLSLAELTARFQSRYAHEPLVRLVDDIPLVRDAAGQHHVTIGGLAVDPRGRRAVVVVTLDNLLKGAATQAVQNLNLALGHPELLGIPVDRDDGVDA